MFAPVGRFRQLVGNARQENLLHVRYRSVAALDSPDLARRLRIVLERSGGMFVKFGQIASTRTDLLPATITDELSNLHADVERVPPDEVEKVLEAELGEPVDQAFDEFESEPLAAASIGPDATARSCTAATRWSSRSSGRAWRRSFSRDGSVLSLVARTLERRVEAARRIGARELADELVQSIQEELDFQREALAGIRLRENRKDDLGVAVPAVHRTLTTRRVLVMEEVDGRPLTDAGWVDTVPVERHELARRLLSSFLGQILQDGYYHADPHPGQHPAQRRWHALAPGLRLGRSPGSGHARVAVDDGDRVLDPRRLADRAGRATPRRRHHAATCACSSATCRCCSGRCRVAASAPPS